MNRQQQLRTTSALQARQFQSQDIMVPAAPGTPAAAPAAQPPAPVDNRAAPPAEGFSVRDVMDFDFFSGLELEGTTRTPAAPVIRAPDPRPPAQAAPPSATPAAAPATPLAIANQETIANMLAQLRQQLPAAAGAAPATPSKSRDPYFKYSLPLEVVQLVRSDNDKDLQAGMEVIYNSAMNNAVDFMEAMLQRVVIPALQAQWRQETQFIIANQKKLDAFYKDFPELDSDVGRAVTDKVSNAVAAHVLKTTGLAADRASDVFMRQVGAVAMAYIRQLAGVPEAPPADPNVPPGQPAAPGVPSTGNRAEHPRFDPAFTAPRGSRPTPAAPLDEQQQEMADVAGAFGVTFTP